MKVRNKRDWERWETQSRSQTQDIHPHDLHLRLNWLQGSKARETIDCLGDLSERRPRIKLIEYLWLPLYIPWV